MQADTIQEDANETSNAGLATQKGDLEQQAQNTGEKKKSNIFVVWCILSSILIGISVALRGVVSDTPFATKFSLSLSFFVLSFVSLMVYRVKGGDKFVWPFLKQYEMAEAVNLPSVKKYRFAKTQTFMLILGGCCEFMISLFIILAFNAALKANINQGIGTSLITLNAVIVSIFSYVFFREKITVMNGLGIVVIIIALVVIGLTGPKGETKVSPMGPQEAGTSKTGQTVLVIVFGIVAAIFSAFEVLVSKYLMLRCNISGDISGICFQLFEGLVGTICLIVLSVNGKGVHEFESGGVFGFVMLAGLLAFTSLTVLNYAVSVGVAGVAISIFNCSAAIHVLISSIFLGQQITGGQVSGVVLALAGATLLTIGDMVIDKLTGKDDKRESKDSQATKMTDLSSSKKQSTSLDDA